MLSQPAAVSRGAAAPGTSCIELQRKEWADGTDFPTRSHHEFSGVPYHVVGEMYGSARLGRQFVDDLPEDKVV